MGPRSSTKASYSSSVNDFAVDDHRSASSPSEQLSPRQTRMLDELERLFFDEGFLHFRMEDLARRLRCSKHSFYALAPGRDQLFELVLERFLSRVRAVGEKAAKDAPDVTTALTAYLDVCVRATRDNSVQFVRDLAEFTPARRMVRALQRKRVDGLEQIVADGIKAGEFLEVPPKFVAELVLLVIGRIVDPHFLRSCDLSLTKAYEAFYGILIQGLQSKRCTR
jgi:AcrR family transcriptional regulator